MKINHKKAIENKAPYFWGLLIELVLVGFSIGYGKWGLALAFFLSFILTYALLYTNLHKDIKISDLEDDLDFFRKHFDEDKIKETIADNVNREPEEIAISVDEEGRYYDWAIKSPAKTVKEANKENPEG